jgi:hypothetical protein
MQTLTADQARTGEAPTEDGVDTVIRYVVPGEKAVFYPWDRERSYWPPEDHRMRVESMRPLVGRLALERNGFVLVREPTKVRNFHDEAEMKNVYYPEVYDLVKRLNGAAKVIAFGEVARTDSAQAADGRKPAHGAHVDYGEVTVRAFAEEILGKEEAAHWLKMRFVLMNLWRPITTVYRSPLAVCDASTVRKEDLNGSEVRGGLMDPNRATLHGFNLQYSPRHRWYYAPRMEPDEVLAFKLFDSDSSRVQWTGHTAFDDPSSPPDAPSRQSIEVRTISFIPDA